MVVQSSGKAPCDRYWPGGKIFVNVNGVQKGIIPSRFQEYRYCLSSDQVNVEKDQIRLQSSNTNGVCIQSLSVFGKKIRYGVSQDLSRFWIDGNQNSCSIKNMISSQVTIQNGEIISSKCEGKTTMVNIPLILCGVFAWR